MGSRSSVAISERNPHTWRRLFQQPLRSLAKVPLPAEPAMSVSLPSADADVTIEEVVSIESNGRHGTLLTQQSSAVQPRVLSAEESVLLAMFERTDVVSVPMVMSSAELDFPSRAKVETLFHRLFRAGYVECVPGRGWRCVRRAP